jgi:hypothetical protein
MVYLGLISKLRGLLPLAIGGKPKPIRPALVYPIPGTRIADQELHEIPGGMPMGPVGSVRRGSSNSSSRSSTGKSIENWDDVPLSHKPLPDPPSAFPTLNLPRPPPSFASTQMVPGGPRRKSSTRETARVGPGSPWEGGTEPV